MHQKFKLEHCIIRLFSITALFIISYLCAALIIAYTPEKRSQNNIFFLFSKTSVLLSVASLWAIMEFLKEL